MWRRRRGGGGQLADKRDGAPSHCHRFIVAV
jgi:hypothetical protein